MEMKIGEDILCRMKQRDCNEYTFTAMFDDHIPPDMEVKSASYEGGFLKVVFDLGLSDDKS